MKKRKLLPCKIIMLSTEMSNLIIRPNDKLYLVNDDEIKQFERDLKNDGEQYWDPQHLYLVSSRKIKENTKTINEGFDGDWYYNTLYNCISQIGDITEYDFKIEATTDPKLKLPSIPQSFIKKYVKSNGEIKEVNIEMEDICDETCNDILSNINECCGQPNWKIKTNSDNMVIIHPIINDEKLREDFPANIEGSKKFNKANKEDYRNELLEKKYSKEDVINICKILNLAHQTKRISGEESTFDFDKWIEENL